jgi:DNA-binding GntR family transcriptional regulator
MGVRMSDESGIARSVLADQVKDRLLQDILAGVYPPDSRIVETRVARDLGTSQAPVREALRGLEALGVVDITPFRGARVRRPTAGELLEAYEVRAELESLGARLGVPRLTDAELDELEALGDEMQAAARVGDRHAVAIADASFHGRLVRIAGNRTLDEVWRSLEPFSRTYITLIVPGADAAGPGGLHTPILEALRTRDSGRVEAALRRHFREASIRLAESWKDEAADPLAVGRRGRRGRP